MHSVQALEKKALSEASLDANLSAEPLHPKVVVTSKLDNNIKLVYCNLGMVLLDENPIFY